MSRFSAWVNKRLPVDETIKEHMTEYFAPRNFNILYYAGSLLLLMIVLQLISGFFLMAHYVPTSQDAFASVQGIMYDTKWGWLIRYMHVDGVSLIFILLYTHMFRGLLYGSHRAPRELVWVIGYVIYLLMMAEAFVGYVLPFGNLSYWAGEVITSIMHALPVIGPSLTTLTRGGPGIGSATLQRFLALHVVLFFLIILAAIALHIVALHRVGSNNPDGIDIKKHKGPDGKPLDGVPFHPYYTVKDLFGVGVWLTIFVSVIFYAPTMHGVFMERTTFLAANPMVSLPDVTPPWYLSPYYAMLRAVPNKYYGIAIMITSVLLPLLLPWLDRNPVRSSRYRPVYRIMLIVAGISFIVLAWIGQEPPLPKYFLIERVATALYLGFYLLLPFVSMIEPTRPVPERVTG